MLLAQQPLLYDSDATRRKRILDVRSYFTIGSAPLMERSQPSAFAQPTG
jgi:hypothetical protein